MNILKTLWNWLTAKKKKRMLVMDDEVNMREMLSEYFEGSYLVDQCEGLATGRSFLSKHGYDVCVFDNDADTVGAGEALSKLAKAKNKKTRVILITGKPLKREDSIRIEKLVDVLFKKPVSLKTIKDFVEWR
jgi:DNA-binding NtrC family response regulator